MRACVFLTRTPHIPEGETVVVLPPEQADLFEYAGDFWADSVEDALGMLAKGVPGYWLERPSGAEGRASPSRRSGSGKSQAAVARGVISIMPEFDTLAREAGLEE